ncbi:MAG: glycosyltransferase [Clostridia bacterium]|nr:glycosyltransferase [Clostridia bacterium]
MNKKVLFTATVDPHILHFHIPYLKLFKENGYEVYVATNGEEEIPYCDVKHKVSFERSPLKVNNLRAIKQLKKIINEEKFEIIHCHTPMGSVVTRLAAIKARKNGTRVIYTAHGFHFYKGAPLINWIMFYPIEKILSYVTDDLITINQEDYELAKKKFHAKNTHYVPGVGVNPQKFNFEMSDKEKHNLRAELSIKDDDIVLIYVAELNKNKNQGMAINAMKALIKEEKKYKLIFVGKDSYGGIYQKQVKEYNLEKNIKFLGYRKDVPQLMKISDVAVSTSKREGLPVNLIEASMCGLPIVATNCRGNRDIVNNSKNGYIINNGDIQNMCKSIISITNNIEEYKSNENKYNLNDILMKIEKIYNFNNDNEPIRVLHVIRAMNMGGAETFIMNLYRNIDREKIQFDFLTSREGCYDKEIKLLGGRIYEIPYLTDKGQLEYIKNLKKIFKTHQEYKIVHSHIDQVSGIILQTAKKCNVPVRLAHSHSTSNNNGFIAKMYKKYLQNKINKNATELLACSEESAKWLYKKEANRAIIINNGIDISKFKYSNEKRCELRNELNIPEDYIVIGHVGGFRKEKNHEFLLEIFSEYLKMNPKSYLVLLGDGILREKIEQKMEQLNINNNVKILGIKNNNYDYYNIFDVFAFPSIYEGVPLTLIEAMSNGLKVLASNNITKDINRNNLISYIELEKKDEWIKQLSESCLRECMDISIDLDEYNINKTVEKYQKLIEEKSND